MATRTYLTTEQENLVLGATSDWKLRDRTLILFGLRTGFRARELASITIAQVWDGARVRDEVTVARCNLKNGRGPRRASVRSRTVPLAPELQSLLQDFLAERIVAGSAEPSAPLFLSTQADAGIGRWMINRLVQRACQAAGLPRHGRWGSHTLRKTFAKRVFVRSGHEINLTRAALGHRDIATTQRYLEVSEGDLRRAILG